MSERYPLQAIRRQIEMAKSELPSKKHGYALIALAMIEYNRSLETFKLQEEMAAYEARVSVETDGTKHFPDDGWLKGEVDE